MNKLFLYILLTGFISLNISCKEMKKDKEETRFSWTARSFAYEVLREEGVYKLEKVKHDIVKEDGVRKLKPRKNERGGTYVDVQIQGKNVKYEKILPSTDSLRSDIDKCSYDIEGYWD